MKMKPFIIIIDKLKNVVIGSFDNEKEALYQFMSLINKNGYHFKLMIK